MKNHALEMIKLAGFLLILVAYTIFLLFVEYDGNDFDSLRINQCRDHVETQQVFLFGIYLTFKQIILVIVISIIILVYSYFIKSSRKYDILYFVSAFVIGLIFRFAEAYSKLGITGQQSENAYLDLIYFSAITMSTVGYGDFQPCPIARPLALLQGVLGVILFPVVVAVVLNTLSLEDKS